MTTSFGKRQRIRPFLVEGTVIVISILLAFSIEAWWDRTQAEAGEREWIGALLLDLESAQVQIREAISQSESIVDSGERVLELLSDTLPLEADSVRRLTSRMMRPTNFTPTLPSFETGSAVGRFSGLESIEFRRGHADFRQALEHFTSSRRLAGESIFWGPLFEARARYGGFQFLGNVNRGDRFRLSDQDYLGAVASPETLAALETVWLAQANQLWSLRGMSAALDEMVSALGQGAR